MLFDYLYNYILVIVIFILFELDLISIYLCIFLQFEGNEDYEDNLEEE